jgi:hypothetical protein
MQGCVLNVEGMASRHDSVVFYLNDEILKVYKGGSFHYSDTLRQTGEYRLAVVAVNNYGEEIRSFSYKVADGGTTVDFLSPLSSETTFALGEPVNVVLQGTNTDRLTLWHNGYEVATVSGSAYLNHRLAGIADTGVQQLYASGTAACSDGSASRSFNIVKPQVTLSSSAGLSVAVGSNVTVTANAPFADSIFFKYGNMSIAKQGSTVNYIIYGITSGVHVFTASAKGKYYDGTSSSTLTITAGVSGNETFNKSGLRIYPNPVSGGVLHIEGFTGEYILLDISGRIVRKGRLAGGSGVVNVNGLSAGIYVLRVGSGAVKLKIES